MFETEHTLPIQLKMKRSSKCFFQEGSPETQEEPIVGEEVGCLEKETEREIVDKLYASMKSRMIVAEVVSSIRANSNLTFDYVFLVFLASSISFFGLLENSSVILVASMLVSPIMGPILAGNCG